MCRRRRGGCRMPDWLRDYEARLCSILAILSFSCAVTSFAVFTDSAVLSLTVALKPAVCTVISSEELYGLTKCQWTSCRGSCTAMFYNCTQIKVSFTLTSGNSTTNASNFDFPDNSHETDMPLNSRDIKYNITKSPLPLGNKTNLNIILDPDIAKLFEETEETIPKNSSAPLFHEDRERKFQNSSHNFSSRIDLTWKIIPNISYDSGRDVTGTREARSTNFDNENFMAEFLKEYEGYNALNLSNNTFENASIIPLYVNIFGCGYEPVELCDQFFANYTHVGMEFQCLISLENEVFAVPNPDDYDFTKFKDPMRSLLLSLIPLGVCVISAFYIRVRRLFRMPRSIGNVVGKKKRLLSKTEAEEEKEYTTPILGSRASTKMSIHKNGKERLPAFIKVQSSSPAPVHPCQVIDHEQFL